MSDNEIAAVIPFSRDYGQFVIASKAKQISDQREASICFFLYMISLAMRSPPQGHFLRGAGETPIYPLYDILETNRKTAEQVSLDCEEYPTLKFYFTSAVLKSLFYIQDSHSPAFSRP